MEKKRVLWLDIAKAAGIIIVLLVHTGRSFGPVSFFGGMFYMPIFFVLAGMTFRYKPEESFADFTKKKARRLLVPYFGYNLFLFLFFFVKNDLLAGQALAFLHHVVGFGDSRYNLGNVEYGFAAVALDDLHAGFSSSNRCRKFITNRIIE